MEAKQSACHRSLHMGVQNVVSDKPELSLNLSLFLLQVYPCFFFLACTLFFCHNFLLFARLHPLPIVVCVGVCVCVGVFLVLCFVILVAIIFRCFRDPRTIPNPRSHLVPGSSITTRYLFLCVSYKREIYCGMSFKVQTFSAMPNASVARIRRGSANKSVPHIPCTAIV